MTVNVAAAAAAIAAFFALHFAEALCEMCDYADLFTNDQAKKYPLNHRMSQFWLVCLFIHFGISEQQKNDENSAFGFDS